MSALMASSFLRYARFERSFFFELSTRPHELHLNMSSSAVSNVTRGQSPLPQW